ncbi:MAG: Na/Pi cotransporter family protein [Candidatus Krumholzibacteriota bacterium]|nr:Na/Pi cotransporter family protein [Candidatus Krumholzibacteriota bacterium]
MEETIAIDPTEMIYFLIGGLGFFLFGIKFMSEGLRKVSSDRLKNILHLLTKRRLVAFLVGAGVTALLQSSSATTVMVVGFINASLLTLKQSIPVVMGANIGTTVTAWLVSFMAVFKITKYALPAAGIGFLLMVAARRTNLKQWGEVIFGFGALFVGIGFMKDAFGPLESSQRVIDVMVYFSRYPILGVLVGTVVTMLLQSSSASIAIIQVLAWRGLIDFPASLALVLGDNIGTTITAQIAALNGSSGAKRVAWAHTLFNVFGASYMLVLIYLKIYPRVIETLVPGPLTDKNIMFHIALAHTVFNSFNSMVFLPLIPWLQKVVEKLIKSKPEDISLEPQYLERHLLDTPVLALEQSRREIVRMLHLASSAMKNALEMFREGKMELAAKVSRREDAVDNLQAEITRYLIDISMEELDQELAEMIPVLIHSVNDIERISDQAENIVEIAQRKYNKNLKLSDGARERLDKMIEVASGMLQDVSQGLESGDVLFAKKALKKETQLNQMQINLRQYHVHQLNEGACNIYSGLIFLDCVDFLEKIGDHLANIAEGLLGGFRWE